MMERYLHAMQDVLKQCLARAEDAAGKQQRMVAGLDLAGDELGQQRFAAAGWPDQQAGTTPSANRLGQRLAGHFHRFQRHIGGWIRSGRKWLAGELEKAIVHARRFSTSE